jgi:hypothetical protein
MVRYFKKINPIIALLVIVIALNMGCTGGQKTVKNTNTSLGADSSHDSSGNDSGGPKMKKTQPQ